MKDYIHDMINEFPHKIGGQVKTPWMDNLFKERKKGQILEKNKKKIFHTYIMKLMFLSKCGRPDILTGVTYLSTKLKSAKEDNWSILLKNLSYLQNTTEKIPILEATDDQII